MKKYIFLAIKIAFICGIFVLIFTTQEVTPLSILDFMRELDPASVGIWLTFASAVKLMGIFSGIVRWKLLLKGQGITMPFWYLTKCWFMGRAVGWFVPGTLGLDGYRLVESSVFTKQPIKCAIVIAVEKLIGFIALGILVFLTLPLGRRLFDFNSVMLGGLLAGLFCFISVSFLLLFQPRIVQVIAAALPTPAIIRGKVNSLGTAVTAYSGHRGTLLLAVLFGLCVHGAICLMYFGTAMAMSEGKADFRDVLFTSPLVIVGSVITPTVSGMGVREAVFSVLLSDKYGGPQAFLFGHMGLWAGEMVPFLLSLPLLIFTTRPKRGELLEDAAEVRAATRGMVTAIALTPEEVRGYRRKLAGCVFGGALAGLVGGAAFGLWEARWHLAHMGTISDSAAYWWAPLVYGITCVPLGLGVAAGLTFFYLLFNRFAPAIVTFSLGLAGTVGVLGLVIGQFRYKRDVLAEAAMKTSDYLTVGEYAAGAALVMLAAGLVLGYALNAMTRGRIAGPAGVALGMAAYLGLVTVGVVVASKNAPSGFRGEFKSVGAKGPNIFLIAVDTLRADFTTAYNKDSHAKTPAVEALASDGVIFQKMFAQSSWTKASFGTIFSGMYPETHSATGKTSALPDEVITIAEALKDAGYYTKGYSNNPNITSIWNYDQGFSDYADMKPNLYFGATGSCEKLVLYDILRKVVQTAYAKLGGWLFITDFYQPGDVVTDTGLQWLDSPERPKDAPFYLFLHYMDPHDPYRDPDRPGHGYARVRMEDPDPEKFKDKLVRAYSYEVEFADAQIGRLIEGLKSRGLYEDALIVFTADHGEEFHEHGGWWHGLSLYDEQIAVPLIMKLPGNATKGNSNPGIARSLDIAPTIAELAGAKKSDRWQGIPLFTTDLQPGNGPTEKAYAHLNFEGIELRALRTQDRKLIQSNENKRKYPALSFFDMVADPGEQVNLADVVERAEEIKKFIETTEAMKAYVLENKAEPSISEAGMEETKEQLESLGYLE